MPVHVCSPVGEIVDQVVDGKTGVLATGVTAAALADAIDAWLWIRSFASKSLVTCAKRLQIAR